jgi:hypothetical protein
MEEDLCLSTVRVDKPVDHGLSRAIEGACFRARARFGETLTNLKYNCFIKRLRGDFATAAGRVAA